MGRLIFGIVLVLFGFLNMALWWDHGSAINLFASGFGLGTGLITLLIAMAELMR